MNCSIFLLSILLGVFFQLSQCFMLLPGTSRYSAAMMPATKFQKKVKEASFRASNTKLQMVFDFFKQKSSEGLDQLNKLADASYKGELGQGLADVAAYTKASNAAFASGLAKSRVQLLQNLETLFTGVSPEDVLTNLEDILLQADLGIAVAEEVVEEVRALREDSTKMLSKDDLKSILRGKLIEALDTGKPEAVQFSTREDIPTVIFVMGANGMGKYVVIA